MTGALVADGADLAVTLTAGDDLPRTGRSLVLSIAAAAVVLGATALASLD